MPLALQILQNYVGVGGLWRMESQEIFGRFSLSQKKNTFDDDKSAFPVDPSLKTLTVISAASSVT